MEKTKATIPLLYDLDGSVIDRYGLLFTPPPGMQAAYERVGHPIVQANPSTGMQLPIPATYVVASDGLIAARYINADYTYRMEPADVLQAAQAAAGV